MPTWSDLDILIVLKSDKFGNIDLPLINRLRNIHNSISVKFPEIEISLLPHTMYDFENYVAYEYLKNYQFATIYYTTEVVCLKDRIEELLMARNVSLEVQKRYAIYRLRHLRFNLLRAVASWKGGNKAIAKLVIDRLIQSGIYITGFYGEYAQGKRDRLEMLKRLIHDKEIVSIFDWATNLRFNWPKITEAESEKIIKEGIEGLYSIICFMVSKYPEKIPEEFMNK